MVMYYSFTLVQINIIKIQIADGFEFDQRPERKTNKDQCKEDYLH